MFSFRPLHWCFDGFKVLRVSYQQGGDTKCRFSTCFFLPDSRDGLPALLEKSGSESGFINRHFPYELVKNCRLWIPRFKIEFGFEVSKALDEELGVVLGGGLTEMVNQGGEDLSVSQILHKSYIEVDEEGTEAAAVTVLMRATWCSANICKVEYVNFIADHPFMFVLRKDESGAVLVIGQMFNPLAAKVTPKQKLETDRDGKRKIQKIRKCFGFQ